MSQIPHIGDDEKLDAAKGYDVIDQFEQASPDGAKMDLSIRYVELRHGGLSHLAALADLGDTLAAWYPTSTRPEGWPVTPPAPPPPPPGAVRKLVGPVRLIGRSFGDDTGPRILHGCTDFGGVVKYHEDRDKALASLDVTAAHQQYIRVAYRLNGWLWTTSGLTLDPSRDAWWEDSMRGYLQACHDRGLRVMLTCADMNDWTDAQMDDGVRRAAQIAASVSPTVVWLHEWNELRSIWRPGDENDAQVEKLRALSRIWQQHYPWSQRGLSDPASQDRDGMKRLSQDPATVALIHNVRWSAADAIRRAFNAPYDNWPGKPIVEGEPTGPNGSPPQSDFSRHVYQPTEDHDDLAAIYTMLAITGQGVTYFNDPALVSREPLDSTWGFKEIPALWRQMEIPEHIGQGTLSPGHWPSSPLHVIDSNAERADSMVLPGYDIGVISGGSNWRVRSGRRGVATAFRASGPIWEGRVSPGDVFPISGPQPTIIRIVP
jgi:hypothetical protein